MDYGDPISYLVLEQGIDVISSDGERVGALETVLADDAQSVFDGIIIDIRTGPGGQRFVDADHVGELYERAVVLPLTADEVEQLPPPPQNPAVVTPHGPRRTFWDRLLGR
jgi:hypothetical protein